MSVPATVPTAAEIAETLNLFLPPSSATERVVTERFVAFVGPAPSRYLNIVQRIRFEGLPLASVVDEVRAVFRARGRSEVTWEIGPSSTPPGLHDQLLALGMVPDAEPVVAGMVLTKPLSEARGSTIEVRAVVDRDGYRAYATILRRCFGDEPPPTDAELEEEFVRRFEGESRTRRYLAFIDDAPVSAAEAIFLDGAVVLGGGGTLPEARGKGAYRALVAARFRDAEAWCARGAPVLVVQASSMSAPILRALGFETTCEVRVLVDSLGQK